MATFEFLCSLLLGLILGSFLSVLIPRLHENKKGIIAGRSQCPHCRHTLGATELIPLLSYLFLRGHCKNCHKSISPWYPLTELSSALLVGGLYLSTSNLPEFFTLLPIFLVLLFIFFYDLRYKEIHDLILFPGILYTIGLAYYTGDFQSSLMGAGIATVFFGCQYLLSKGRWLGSGDIFIGIFLGFFLGLSKTLLAIFSGYLLGSLMGLILIASQKASGKTALPLGPFLVLGTLLSYFYGAELLDLYWTL